MTDRAPLTEVVLSKRGLDVFALPLKETVELPVLSTPAQVQFWLLFWLRWISRSVDEPVKAIVGSTPLSN